MSQAEAGQGLLYVSECVWPDLGKPETPEQWKAALLLPDGYEIEYIAPPDKPSPYEFSLVRQTCYILSVRHDAIPDVIGASLLPRVTPFYYRESDRVVLIRIEIDRWDGDMWRTVKRQWMEE